MIKMEKRFFVVRESRFDFDETVSAISEVAQEHGWQIASTYDLLKAGQNAGYEDTTRAKTIALYDPLDGHTLLRDDEHKLLSALMPQNVSVYETNDGQVYVAGMNLARISKMFRGVARDGLKASADKRTQTLNDIVVQAEDASRPGLMGLAAIIVGISALVVTALAIAARLRSETAVEEQGSNKGVLEQDEKTT
jgi:uncharacterized protein (DUF302 family)